MDSRLIPIRRILLEHRNPYPPDDLITTYKDFVREREFLHLYQYNPNVFVALVELADRLWDTPGRINRLALVTAIKRYGFRPDFRLPFKYMGPGVRLSLDVAIRKTLFRFYRRAFEAAYRVPAAQRDIIVRYSNDIVRELTFEAEEEQWLIDNIERSKYIRMRVLTYPGRSSLISAWAREHYEDDAYRTWRAMLVARVIDQDPDFEVTRQTLLEDFEYLNKTDIAALETFESEWEAAEAMEEQLPDFLPKSRFPEESMAYFRMEPIDIPIAPYPDLNLSRRFYKTPIDPDRRPFDKVPDFEALRDRFYLNIGFTQRNTMLWALAYSHLDEADKFERMKKYYGDDTHRTFVRICQRSGYYGLLEWLEERLMGGSS